MEDLRVDGVRDHDRLTQLEAELPVRLEAVVRLEDGRVGELAVDLHDPLVRAVVGAAVEADRPVDAMNDPP